MGLFFSRIFQQLFGSKEVRILILGLDNAGKTTILYRLQSEGNEDSIQTIPTIGFNVEVLQYRNIKFQVWDLGGLTLHHICIQSCIPLTYLYYILIYFRWSNINSSLLALLLS